VPVPVQLELAAEFGKFVFDHPEIDQRLRGGAFVYLEVTGAPESNHFGRDVGPRLSGPGRLPRLLQSAICCAVIAVTSLLDSPVALI
jgi:hypothetical protein